MWSSQPKRKALEVTPWTFRKRWLDWTIQEGEWGTRRSNQRYLEVKERYRKWDREDKCSSWRKIVEDERVVSSPWCHQKRAQWLQERTRETALQSEGSQQAYWEVQTRNNQTWGWKGTTYWESWRIRGSREQERGRDLRNGRPAGWQRKNDCCAWEQDKVKTYGATC